MNREEKRKFRANAKKRGFTDAEVDYMFNHKPNESLLWDGAKVKLDTIWMRLSPDWYNNRLRRDYKEWVLAHKDEVFTVELDEQRKTRDNGKHKDYDLMVCLKEDKTNPKWLFFAGDLILLPGGTNPPDSIKVNEKDNKNINKSELKSQVQRTNEKIQDAIQEALEREKNR